MLEDRKSLLEVKKSVLREYISGIINNGSDGECLLILPVGFTRENGTLSIVERKIDGSVLVLGDPGTGKTSLIKLLAFLELLQDDEATVYISGEETEFCCFDDIPNVNKTGVCGETYLDSAFCFLEIEVEKRIKECHENGGKLMLSPIIVLVDGLMNNDMSRLSMLSFQEALYRRLNIHFIIAGQPNACKTMDAFEYVFHLNSLADERMWVEYRVDSTKQIIEPFYFDADMEKYCKEQFLQK